MKSERASTSKFIVYLTHDSSSAQGGLAITSADPSSLSAVMRNNTIVIASSAVYNAFDDSAAPHDGARDK